MSSSHSLALVMLLHAVGTSARGYHADFQSIGEVMGVKTRLGGLDGLREGFTLGAWLKYRDSSTSRANVEVSIVTASDSTFFNGVGGPGKASWMFGSGQTAVFSDQQPAEAASAPCGEGAPRTHRPDLLLTVQPARKALSPR